MFPWFGNLVGNDLIETFDKTWSLISFLSCILKKIYIYLGYIVWASLKFSLANVLLLDRVVLSSLIIQAKKKPYQAISPIRYMDHAKNNIIIFYTTVHCNMDLPNFISSASSWCSSDLVVGLLSSWCVFNDIFPFCLFFFFKSNNFSPGGKFHVIQVFTALSMHSKHDKFYGGVNLKL